MLQESLTAGMVATGLAATLAPFLTHITKDVLGVDSLKAYAIHLASSALTSIAALYITGEMTGGNFGNKFAQVTFFSQTAFRLYKAATGLRVSPTPTEEEPTPPVPPVA